MSVGSGLHRARSFMVLATGLYRLSHLVAGAVAVVQHQRDSALSWLGLAVAVTSSLLVFGRARARGWFGVWPPGADALLVGCALPFAVLAGGVDGPQGLSWAMLLGGSASAVCAVAYVPAAAVGAVLAALLATHAAGYVLAGADVAVLAAHLNALVWSAVLARVFWWYLRRQGTLLDTATAQALAAEAERARYAERIAHHRDLHDTVLATLTAIASGRADADALPVRERCAREAAYLRRLAQRHASPDDAPGVAEALERAVRAAESLGLRVTAQYQNLQDIPGPAAAALGSALTEALNNVLRHAGTHRAWVMASGHPGGLSVSVVDRGRGFDPLSAPAGRGLASSVRGRMREAGGTVEVDSAPGEGTRIALRWPA
ncbi:sensor histidine kinase [Streptomyces sp. NPDC001046]|uniref:sensor histidine kinase n=1 Tax=Streptomyces sp. NPDC001046 TaxID=3364543 RepID=UPI0036B372FE